MTDFKKDALYFFGFLILLFIGWIVTGGPEHARQTGDAYNKFQKPLAPLDSGETYDKKVNAETIIDLTPFGGTTTSDQNNF